MRSTGNEAPKCVVFSSFMLLTNCFIISRVELTVTSEGSANIECGINKGMLVIKLSSTCRPAVAIVCSSSLSASSN